MDIIVTGCSRGIGFELAKRFAAEKTNRVLAISRKPAPIEKLQKMWPDTLIPFIADITTPDFPALLIQKLDHHGITPSVLINNAGLLIKNDFHALDGADFDAMYAVNVRSPFLIIQVLMPYFSKPAHIVNISSMGGFQGSVKFPGLSLYSATKGALAVLTESLAVELSGSGIAVNCLALGSAQTEMLEEAFPNYVAPVSAASMAGFIHRFALEGRQFFNGKVIPVAGTTP